MDTQTLLNRSLDGKKIGLLGGSFNPAHDGHLAMSLFALDRLKLDEIWWVVTPQNPLKSQENMASLEMRATCAEKLTALYDCIHVTTIEKHFDTQYTVDTLRAMKAHWPQTHFVFLMGEDNLKSIDRWHEWREFFMQLPIAVFRRSGYVDSCRRDDACAIFANAELPLTSVENLAVSPPPVWVVLDNELNPLSATQLRERSKPT